MSKARCRIVVLISGGGTNLQALIDAQQADQLGGEIVAVISNRPDVQGLERARRADIPAICVDHKAFTSREAFDDELAEQIDTFKPDLVVLAGFMRILTPEFVQHYRGRMLNIHPSLLPKYRGLHTHQRAIEAGDREHGASVHFVTEELDGGSVILQAEIPITTEHTPDTLAADLLRQEHVIYPIAVNWFCHGRLRYHDDRAWLDGQPLTHPVRLDALSGSQSQ